MLEISFSNGSGLKFGSTREAKIQADTPGHRNIRLLIVILVREKRGPIKRKAADAALCSGTLIIGEGFLQGFENTFDSD